MTVIFRSYAGQIRSAFLQAFLRAVLSLFARQLRDPELPPRGRLAEALRVDPIFRSWFIEQTRFAVFASTAMKPYPHIAECGERETGLLAIFEAPDGFRFASSRLRQ
jgi:hypothetical protein